MTHAQGDVVIGLLCLILSQVAQINARGTQGLLRVSLSAFAVVVAWVAVFVLARGVGVFG